MQRNVALVNIRTILYKIQIPRTGKIRTVERVKISGRKRKSLEGEETVKHENIIVRFQIHIVPQKTYSQILYLV